MPSPTLYIDADACPVKDEALKIADRHGLAIVFVANTGLRPSRDPMIRYVMVPQGADAADDWIVEHLMPNDVVVTADIPLADRALKAGAQALGPTGKSFTEASIGMALAMRDLNRHLRETGEGGGYNAGFSPADRSRFLSSLDETVRRAIRAVG
jgi:uncharacterized protein YaiI (UPF0178 family)